jgi:hypothetical protein
MLLHHQKHHQAYVTGFNKALEQLSTASDPRAIVALQSAVNFNGGGNAPGLIFGVHPVSIDLCILIQYPIVWLNLFMKELQAFLKFSPHWNSFHHQVVFRFQEV